jgi:diacylglycerol O-acyltransferase
VARNLTDTEALLWNLEQNPNFASTMGAIAILDGSPDPDRLRHTVANALTQIPALRDRVYEPATPIGMPQWGLDTHFDLDSHLRFIRTANPTSRRALFDLASQIVNEPFDRTRPLWSWTIVTGLGRGKAAVISKFHHSIADGQGALKLAAHLLEFAPDQPAPKPLTAADAIAAITAENDLGTDGQPGLITGLRAGAERLRGALAQAANTLQDPGRMASASQDAASAVKVLRSQMTDGAGSDMWEARSRNRRARFLSVPLESMKAVATSRGCSLNDVFVAACARGVVNYHEAKGVELAAVSATVVISTRGSDDSDAQNAIVPVAVNLPGAGASSDDLLATVGDAVRERREQLSGSTEMFGPLTGLFGLVPVPLLSAIALEQLSKVDISTSNLPGPPVPIWVASQRVTQLYPLGPVAGTACNLTMLSYDGTAHLGLHVDPAAIKDPDLFASSVANGFVDLGVRRPKTG